MPNNPRSKPWSQFPLDHNLGSQSKQCLDYILTQLNQLVNQGPVPPSQNLASFGPNQINPTGPQIVSAGSRVSAIATAIGYVAHPTTISFYWDGSNGTQPFQLFRDDGTTLGPFITGSPQAINGLTASTLYFFYPYWDETLQLIQFATNTTAVGTPAFAFTAKNNLAAQQQILRSRVPLAALLSSTGITTPSSGSNTAGGGSGGSGSGIGGSGLYLR